MPITEAQLDSTTFEVNFSLQVGDILFYGNTSTAGGIKVVNTNHPLGEVTEITDEYIGFNYTSVGMSLAQINFLVTSGNEKFISFKKDSSVNVSSLKGYYASVTFMNNDYDNKNELFAIGSQVAISSK